MLKHLVYEAKHQSKATQTHMGQQTTLAVDILLATILFLYNTFNIDIKVIQCCNKFIIQSTARMVYLMTLF